MSFFTLKYSQGRIQKHNVQKHLYMNIIIILIMLINFTYTKTAYTYAYFTLTYNRYQENLGWLNQVFSFQTGLLAKNKNLQLNWNLDIKFHTKVLYDIVFSLMYYSKIRIFLTIYLQLLRMQNVTNNTSFSSTDFGFIWQRNDLFNREYKVC